MSETKAEKRGRMAALASAVFECGVLGFGGGNATIPIFHEKLVKEKKLASEKEFNDAVVISTIIPGAVPVEIAAGIGRSAFGSPGMLLAAGVTSLPGCFLTLILTALLSGFGAALTRQISFLSIGVSAYIIYVLICYVLQTVDNSSAAGSKRNCILLIAAVFLLTCGKQIYELFGIDRTPLFGIPTVNVMAIAFFVIFWMRGEWKVGRAVSAAIAAVLYCLCIGGVNLFAQTPLQSILTALMLVMAVYGLYSDLKRDRLPMNVSLLPMLRECAAAVLFMLVLAVPALLTCDETMDFMRKGCISSLISFGGGDAYLAVAGGMFVTTGMVLYADFYSNLVPVANALPGSILCKLLTGVGYFIGFRTTGSVGAGMAVALCGFGCSIAMSCITYSAGAFFYEKLAQMSVFEQLKSSIRPIVCGLLLTVVMGLLYNCVQIGQEQQWHDGLAPLICLVILAGNFGYVKKFRYKPLRMVAISAAAALICCNLLG